MFQRAQVETWALVTSNAVVMEAYALLLHRSRGGRTTAIRFLDDIEHTRLRVERVTESDESKARALLRSHKDKGYSMCDALSFALCERLHIETSISVDEDFLSYGRLTVYPQVRRGR